MPELEKVVEGLKELRSHFRAMAEIASSNQGRTNHIESARTIGDAIGMLEAQEPMLVVNIHKAYNNVLNPNVPWIGKCPKCGAFIDRDYNAAINIRNEGLLSVT